MGDIGLTTVWSLPVVMMRFEHLGIYRTEMGGLL